MTFKEDLRLLFKPYYLVNIFLSVSYIIAKQVPFVCPYIFPENECELDGVRIIYFIIKIYNLVNHK